MLKILKIGQNYGCKVALNDEIKIITYIHKNANLWRPLIYGTIELRDMIFFSFYQKYEFNNENDKIENRSLITDVVPSNVFF